MSLSRKCAWCCWKSRCCWMALGLCGSGSERVLPSGLWWPGRARRSAGISDGAKEKGTVPRPGTAGTAGTAEGWHRW